MAFFREYLRENKVLYDPRFDETDEDFLVQALLQARMNKSNSNIVSARASHSRLLNAKIMTGLKFICMIFSTILETSDCPER